MRTERVEHNHIFQAATAGCKACRLIRPEVMVGNAMVFNALRYNPVPVFGPPPQPRTVLN